MSDKKIVIALLVVGVLFLIAGDSSVGGLLLVGAVALFLSSRKKRKQAQPKEAEPDFQITVDFKPDNSPVEAGNSSIVPFEQSKKSCYPSVNGLYPAEILLIEYCKHGNYPMESQLYPGFWWYRYGVHDVNILLDSLEKRGFICPCSAVEQLPTLTVERLKELLSRFGLPTSGRKAVLVQRLTDSVTEQSLRESLPWSSYKPTELGFQEVEQNGYVPYLHRTSFPAVEIQRMNELVFQNPLESWQSLLWEELERLKENAVHGKQYSDYRNICMNQYFFAMVDSSKEDAFRFLAETMHLDLNREKISLSEEELSSCVAPGLVKYLSDLRNQLGYDEPTMIIQLMNVFGDMEGKISYLDDFQTAEIIAAYVFGHPETAQKNNRLSAAKLRRLPF